MGLYNIIKKAAIGTMLAGSMALTSGLETKLHAQVEPPAIEWEKTFGGTGKDYGYGVQLTNDGGYILAGSTRSFGAGSYDVYLIKIDKEGNKEWQKTYGKTRSDQGYSLQKTDDGGFVIAGSTNSFREDYNYDVYLVKTDANGNLEWEKSISLSLGDVGYSVQQTSDGGYIIAGKTDVEYPDIYLVKTDTNGNLEWDNTFSRGPGSRQYGRSVQQTTDKGYIVLGYIDYGGVDGKYYYNYLIKTDMNGKIQWEKVFNSEYGNVFKDSTRGYSVMQTSDEGYIIAGTSGYSILEDNTITNHGGVYLVKIDSSGNKEWEKVLENKGVGYSLQKTNDEGYIIAGNKEVRDAYLLKTDINGNLKWEMTFGGINYDESQSVQQTTDGGYILVGSTESFGAGMSDVYLVKLAPEKLENKCENKIMDGDEEGIDCGGSCPQACGNCVPIINNGDSSGKIDVVFMMAQDYNNDWNQFRQDIQNVIQNSLYADPIINANKDKFNFWYLARTATVNDDNGDCDWKTPKGWKRDCPQRDIGAILHVNSCRDHSSRKVFSSEPTSLGTFLHESGHGIFGLADEYDDSPDCGTSYHQPTPFANIFRDQPACQQGSTNPIQCITPFTTCKNGWWKTQPDFTIMNCCGRVNYPANICPWGPDAERQVNHKFSLYTGKGAGGADEERKAIIVDLRYNGETVDILGSTVVYGTSPEEHIEYDSGLMFKVRNSLENIVNSIDMKDPRYKHEIDPPFKSEIIPEAEFSLVVPFTENINTLEVSDIMTEKQFVIVDVSQPVRDFCEEHPEDMQCQRYDSDNDSIPDLNDNCPSIANPDQQDSDNNSIGDACEIKFIRGDSNADSSFDISDPIHTLLHLYSNIPQPSCKKALDSDDSGVIEITDAIYSLNTLFKAGPSPTEPYPSCGIDRTQNDNDLSCDFYPCQ